MFNSSLNPGEGVALLLKKQLQWLLFLRVIFYTLLVGVTVILNQMGFNFIFLPGPLLLLLLFLIYFISVFSAVVLIKREVAPIHFGFFQNFLDTIFVSGLIYFSGISNSIFTSIYFFPIITGGLLLPKKGGYFAAAISTFSFGVILCMEFYKLFPSYFALYDFVPITNELKLVNLFAVKGITFFLAAFVSALFRSRLTSTEEALSNTINNYDRLSQLYKTIFDNISTGIITIDHSLRITSTNNATGSITGYSPEKLRGKDITTIFPELDLSKGTARRATTFTKKDGTPIRIGYSLTPLKERRGNKYKTGNLQKDTTSNSTLITLQDISKIEELERKIRQGEKMAAIGLMSAGIAHDFRNPLAAISGSAQVLSTEIRSTNSPFNPDNLELTNIILRESNRLISTISDFLEFARPDNTKQHWFSLENCINEVLQVCKASSDWPQTADIQCDIDSNTDIWADEKQFFTVINHLIQNGITFCPKGQEKIRISSEEIQTENQQERIIISIEDNGTGIEEEIHEKVFEPFFTQRVEGTGLGLAIVKQTLEAHKGSVEISTSSQLGGAKVILSFPLL